MFVTAFRATLYAPVHLHLARSGATSTHDKLMLTSWSSLLVAAFLVNNGGAMCSAWKWEVESLIRKHVDSEITEESRGYIRQICDLAKSHRGVCQYLAVRYVRVDQDEYERGAALAALQVMDKETLTNDIIPVLLAFVRDQRLPARNKWEALFVLAKMADRAPVECYKGLMRDGDPDLQRSLACHLLIHLGSVSCLDKRVEIVRICLLPSSSRNGRVRKSILGSFVTDGERNADAYRGALRSVRAPHHKMLLLLGCMGEEPDKEVLAGSMVRDLCKTSKLAAWYLKEYLRGEEEYNQILRNYSQSPPEEENEGEP